MIYDRCFQLEQALKELKQYGVLNVDLFRTNMAEAASDVREAHEKDLLKKLRVGEKLIIDGITYRVVAVRQKDENHVIELAVGKSELTLVV